MKNLLGLTSIAFLFIISSCATTYPVISDIEDGVNFSKYKTYYIFNDEDGFPLGASPIHKQRIERAIDNELRTMGLSPDLQPDLAVAWAVYLHEVNIAERSYQFFGDWNSVDELQCSVVNEATLAIDFIDVKNRKVIWHGKVSDRIYEGMPKIEEKINAAVQAIFQRYQRDTNFGESMAYAK